jgi:hypothetical protein
VSAVGEDAAIGGTGESSHLLITLTSREGPA